MVALLPVPERNITRKRLQKELGGSRPTRQHAWCLPGAIATDLFHRWVTIVGPEGSPYDGGTFVVHVKIPHDYPFSPPKFAFKTKVYHPNIDPGSGVVKLHFLNVNFWAPLWTTEKILLGIVSLMYGPVIDGGAINLEAAYRNENERFEYEKKARDKTRKYALSDAYSEKNKRPLPWGVSLCRLLRRVAFLQDRGLPCLLKQGCADKKLSLSNAGQVTS